MSMQGETNFPLPEGPIENPGLWRGHDFQDNDRFVTYWSGQALGELSAAVATVKRRGMQPPNFTKDSFPLPTIGDELQAVLEDLDSGRGFSIIRGIPLDDFSDAEAEILFWGLMMHLGVPMSQNAAGHLIGHVRDLGYDVNDTKVRNYQTTAELFFHNDACDVLMLMCRRVARSGGRSRLASIPAMFNAMWAEDPELALELFRPIAFDRRGEPGRPDEGGEPFYVLPILSFHDGLLTCRMPPRSYIHSAERFEGVPKLTAKRIAALDLMDTVVVRPDVSFDFAMAPGDIQLINNYCIFHSRTEFEDFEDPDCKRHMLRAWLSVPNSRPLPPWFEKRWGSVQPGAIRGGIFASRPEN
jgi:hypothetical protein